MISYYTTYTHRNQALFPKIHRKPLTFHRKEGIIIISSLFYEVSLKINFLTGFVAFFALHAKILLRKTTHEFPNFGTKF